jgi:outer membrane receptor protein involved in Fe transport
MLTSRPRARRLSLCIAALLMLTPAAHAQSTATQAPAASADTLDEIKVTGQIIYRDRSDTTESVLEYDLSYFERFEPLSVGDMLKRVPSVTFISDVLEFDGPRLRGLDAGYTQVLINGKRVPGAGADRGFFVDRIPAELVERIEILRSASANRSGDAVAGALNIVLRDGFNLDGGYLRLGSTYYDDSEFRSGGGAVWGGAVGPGQLLLGANRQGRRNPKSKFSQRFDAPGGALVNIEDQSDIRNSTDTSVTASYQVDADTIAWDVQAFLVQTKRFEDEQSREFLAGRRNAASFASLNDNENRIETDSYTISSGVEIAHFGGKSELSVGFAGISDAENEFEDELEYLRDSIPFPEADRFTGDRFAVDIEDKDVTLRIDHEREMANGEWTVGIDAARKDRDTLIRSVRSRFNIPNAPAPSPPIPGTFAALTPVAGGDSTLEEQRLDPFFKVEQERGAWNWEAGLRYERTRLSIDERGADAASGRRIYGFFLPSAHARYSLSENDRINVSLARTVRRPNFDALSPALLEAELGDNDLLGNPLLEPEKAWGFDLGYEHRLGRAGIIGVNVFYRDVQDLIEVASTGIEGSEGPGTLVLQPRNAGDGEVYGVELDLSTPLSALALDNTGVFLNVSWLDSSISDVFGKRQFNDQSDTVFNVGFIQELPTPEVAFGVTYRKQGSAFSRLVGEEVTTRYGADLEAFVEKRFGDAWALRLTGSNLQDASKDEAFNKFNTIADQLSRDFDEFELESESAGPIYQLVLRYNY